MKEERYGSEIKEFEDKNRCFKAVNHLITCTPFILKIRRVSKEKSSYEREVVTNENKLEKMKQEGKDEYELKKQVRKACMVIVGTCKITCHVSLVSAKITHRFS